MKIQQIVDYVFEIAPNPDWGTENVYEFGNGDREVSAVGVAWWITTDMLEQFAKRGINLGLTHERSYFTKLGSFAWGPTIDPQTMRSNLRMKELTDRHGITIHRFHSNIDLVPDWGIPHGLLDQLGWRNFEADWSRGVPVIVHPPVTLAELVDEIKEKLRLPFVRYDGDDSRVVSRIALAWGGIAFSWCAAMAPYPLGFDVLLGGDIIDGQVRMGRMEGWAVIDAFHHATEMRGMANLARKLRDRFPGLQVHDFENNMPWRVRT
jgi:putative NIF3 family GTP cyclohydrolase 1 type 2